MHKVLYIQADFAVTGDEKTVDVPARSGVFGRPGASTQKEVRWAPTGKSDCAVDGRKLSGDVARALAHLDSQGFEVISITPVTSGYYHFDYEKNRERADLTCGGGGYGYGYGFSYTEGVMIVARQTNARMAPRGPMPPAANS